MKTSESFQCFNCGKVVNQLAVGTKNRNHCPFCLWSQHLDIIPGDRKASCGGKMEPVSLAFKGGKKNKYRESKSFEVMIVHRCINCGIISQNRVAGDDSELSIINLFNETKSKVFSPDNSTALSSIRTLTPDDSEVLLSALFGYDHSEYRQLIK